MGIGHGSDAAVLGDLMAIWSLGAAAVMVSKTITASEKDNVLKATRATAWIGEAAPDGVAALAAAPMSAGSAASEAAAQLDDPALDAKAQDCARRLGLGYERRLTGYGDLAVTLQRVAGR